MNDSMKEETTTSGAIAMTNADMGTVAPPPAFKLSGVINPDLHKKYNRKRNRERIGNSYSQSASDSILALKRMQMQSKRLVDQEPLMKPDTELFAEAIDKTIRVIFEDSDIVKHEKFPGLCCDFDSIHETMTVIANQQTFNRIQETFGFVGTHQDKAFYKTLKQEMKKEKMDLAEVKLALFSYGTHLEIYRKENAEFGLYEEKVSGLLNTLKELNQVPEEQIREYITKELFIV